ncbi:hypothetical protein NPX13_g1752 [Xylaria arbuscula]|uniref:Uncharacterized protein n=1 Tax=Xylaria arbuscula TaxID=114810 RepID=A0A9W8NLD3_9PEZI|nr:hypothetical protein NPX13_g1752 [Xylaria arbuscula]
MEPGIMYFNPEYDFLHISNDTGHVAEFIHDLKTVHDPRSVGLLNLAASINDLTGTGGICTIEPSSLDPSIRKSLAETLLQLRQVFFHQTQMLGRQPFPLVTTPYPDDEAANRAFPVETCLPTFRRLRPDPRPIKRDLSKVFVNVDPRRMLLAWRKLLRAYLNTDEVAQTELRILLTHGSYGKVDSAESARARLEYEQTLWTERLGRFSLEGSVATAFGFWLIPTAAFRALPESDHMFRSEPPQLMDLREHWPDLAVTDL